MLHQSSDPPYSLFSSLTSFSSRSPFSFGTPLLTTPSSAHLPSFFFLLYPPILLCFYCSLELPPHISTPLVLPLGFPPPSKSSVFAARPRERLDPYLSSTTDPPHLPLDGSSRARDLHCPVSKARTRNPGPPSFPVHTPFPPAILLLSYT